MKEKLIKLGFEKWLAEQELAPYTVMFWDVPKFIQLAYVQKFLREFRKIDLAIIDSSTKIPSEYYFELSFDAKLDYNYDPEDLVWNTNYEDTLEQGILKALEL